MKRILFLAITIAIVSLQQLYAQCDSAFTITSSQTVYLDSSDNVVRTVDELSTIRVSKTTVTITPGNSRVMSGPVSKHECKWQVPYKDGRSLIIASLSNEAAGESRTINMLLEAKQGVLSLTATVDGDDNKRIKLSGVKFSTTQ